MSREFWETNYIAMDNDLRYEVKMVFDALRLGETRDWVYTHPDAFRVAYPARQINNIYFDTLERELMMDHLDGVANRAKVRLRWYGNTWLAQNGQFEIKIKRGSLGYKKSYPVSLEIDISKLSWREIIKILQESANSELLAVLKSLEPTIINQYKREYYISMDGTVRVTLDYKMQAYEQVSRFTPNIHFQKPLKNSVVIELKSFKNDFLRLSKALSKFPLYCAQNSKYLNGMENAI